jgi:hypothetical protein
MALFLANNGVGTFVFGTLLLSQSVADNCSRHFAMVKKVCRHLFRELCYGRKKLPTFVPDTLSRYVKSAENCFEYFATVQKVCRQLFQTLCYGGNGLPTIVPDTLLWCVGAETIAPDTLLWRKWFADNCYQHFTTVT